jgi:hypothetical protein
MVSEANQLGSPPHPVAADEILRPQPQNDTLSMSQHSG